MDRKKLLAALDDGFIHSVRDPLFKDIMLDEGFRGLFLDVNVQKLDRIRQNGPACHIYPGAVHTRLNHSLGVYHTGRLILKSLIARGDVPFTVTGERSFLAACLLHDIGHFPYAHSLKELSIKEHEELACDLIDSQDSLSKAIKDAGADVKMVKAIINKGIEADRESMIYRNILSGSLDPDKLDYLNRDAFFAGVPYGQQDNGYIISSMRLYEDRIALTEDATASLEHLLLSKYLMYRNVYWHKGVRSATSMIKKALLMAIRDDVLKGEDLYFIDDADFDRLAELNRGYEPFELIDRVSNNQLLARVFEKGYEPGGKIETEASNLFARLEVEETFYSELKKHYPSLKEWEVVIDIQEPISFESDTMIIGKTVRPFNEVTRLFTSEVVKQFALSLRKVAFYLPSYVDADVLKGIYDERYS